MARIRFLSDQVYDTGARKQGPRFPEGFVLDQADVGAVLKTKVTYEYAAGFLERWVRRGVAVHVDGRTPAGQPSAVEEQPAPPPAKVTEPLGVSKRGEPTPGIDDGKQVETVDYASMTRTELDALAAKRAVDLADAKSKGDVIAALELADESA